jgi:hypothetical protein
MTPQITVKIAGIDYPLAWGNLAMFRFRSIQPTSRNLVGPAQLAQLLWAAFKGVQHPFATWEHVLAAIAELSEADYAAVDSAMASALPAVETKAEDEQESKTKAEPTDAEKKSGLTVIEPSPAAVSA